MGEVILTDALTTVARVKDRLQITQTGFDSLLLRIASGVSDFIKHECNIPTFKETTYVRELYSFEQSQSLLFTKNIPVSAVTKLEYNSGTLSVPVWTEYLADEWSFDVETGIIYLEGNFPIGRKTVAVTYTAGYKIDFTNFGDTTKHNLPADLTDLAERMIIKWFKRRESEGKDSESEGGGNITWSKEMAEEDKATVAHHKRSLFY